MIVEKLNLTAAIEQGIVTPHQAQRLLDLATSDNATGVDDIGIDFSQDPTDEPFRFMKGFADLFTAIGVSTFSCGLFLFAPAFALALLQAGATFGLWWTVLSLIMLSALALHLPLANYLILRKRLPLTGLAICVSVAVWASSYLYWSYLGAVLGTHVDLSLDDFFGPSLLWVGVAASVVVAVFYWRYRLPSALLILAVMLVTVISVHGHQVLSIDWFSVPSRVLFAVLGFSVFLAALWFETRDRARVTRMSECAFWLHIVAAPVILYSLLAAEFIDRPTLISLVVVFFGLSVVALLLDRRSFLVAGMIYMGIALGSLISDSNLTIGDGFALTILIVGSVALTLGIGWTAIRTQLLRLIPESRFKDLLPNPHGTV